MKRIMRKSTRRLLAAILAFAILLSLPMGVINASAANSKYSAQGIRSSFEFTIVGGVALLDYYGKAVGKESDTLVIPGTYQGYPVVMNDTTFHYKEYFSKIVISDGVIRLDGEVFEKCEFLTEVEIGSTVESISYNTFYGGNIRRITVSEDNPYYSSEDGVLFNKDKTELLFYPIWKTASAYTVPDTVKSIWNVSLANPHLKTIKFPEGIERADFTLGNYALENIILPESIKEFYMSPIGEKGNVTIYYAGTQEQFAQIKYADQILNGKSGNVTVLYEQKENLPAANDPNEAEKDKAADEKMNEEKAEALHDFRMEEIFALPKLFIAYSEIFLMFIGMGIGTGIQKIVAFLLPWIEWTS